MRYGHIAVLCCGDARFDEEEKRSTRWGIEKSKHGFCWYSAQFKGLRINYGMGYGGQLIIMIPQEELIIVTTHEHDTPDGIKHQVDFLNKELPQLIDKFSD